MYYLSSVSNKFQSIYHPNMKYPILINLNALCYVGGESYARFGHISRSTSRYTKYCKLITLLLLRQNNIVWSQTQVSFSLTGY
jgi:hypothetical protein